MNLLCPFSFKTIITEIEYIHLVFSVGKELLLGKSLLYTCTHVHIL